jgi:hypothetical protein
VLEFLRQAFDDLRLKCIYVHNRATASRTNVERVMGSLFFSWKEKLFPLEFPGFAPRIANQAFLADAAATHLEAAGVAVVVRTLGPEPSSVFFTMDVQPVLPFFS